MEVYGELEPSRSPKKVLERARRIAEIYRRVDIPDIPLGKPSISSPVMSTFVSQSLGADVITHIRVIDHNVVSLKSIVKTLSYININKIIFLRGDPPQQGTVCDGHWGPEEAVSYATKYGIDAGLLISPRKSIESIRERLQVGASSYYVTRVELSNNILEKIKIIIKNVIMNKSRSGLYIVIGTPRNTGYLARHRIPFIPSTRLHDALMWAEKMGVKRVILSAPGDGDSLFSEKILGEIGPWLGK